MTSEHDPGDEDDITTSPRRFWPRILIGRPICYTPLSWSHEFLSPLYGHDPGDEDHFTWLQPNSELTQRRAMRRLCG